MLRSKRWYFFLPRCGTAYGFRVEGSNSAKRLLDRSPFMLGLKSFPETFVTTANTIRFSLLTAIGLAPGGSSTLHIYTQTIHRTIQNKQYIEQHNNFGRVRTVSRLGNLYPGICLTIEEKAQTEEKNWWAKQGGSVLSAAGWQNIDRSGTVGQFPVDRALWVIHCRIMELILYRKYIFHYICIKWTNKMHYILLICFNNKPVHVSSRLAAHHQEDRLCINSNWCSHALCWLAAGRPTASQHNTWLYQLLLIQSLSSWWWAASLLETYRGLLLKKINSK